MSGLELAAVAAMGAAYLDARFSVIDDIITSKDFISVTLYWMLCERSGDVSTYSIFQKYVRTTPNKTFLIYPEPRTSASTHADTPSEDRFIVRKYSYAEAEVSIQKYSTYLIKEHGVKAGDAVAVDFVNKPEYVFVWFALWNIGAAPAMINYNLQGKGLVHCVKISQSKSLIVDEEVQSSGEAVEQELLQEHGIKTIYATEDHFRTIFHTYDQTRYHKRAAKGSDPACYIFTSGTTGLPKAANFSWKKANWGSKSYASVSKYSKNQVLYSAMPLYHSTAAILGLLATLQVGGTYAIGHKFSTSTFWTQARLTGATTIQYVGETCRYLLNAPPSPDDRRHNVTVATGNGMRPDVWSRFKERFGISIVTEFYGATEYPSAINNIQRGGYGVGSCGHYGTVSTYLSNKLKWRIAKVDHDTQELWRDPITGYGKMTEVNEPGEFSFKSKSNNISADFQGYAGNKEATDEKLIFDLFEKGDAYVRSGDSLKIDENNHVYFVDRLGDTFRWKSENVSTNEVEESIAVIPNVDLAVCVGVKVPQHEGRAGFAVVKLKDPSKSLDMKALGEHLVKESPAYAVPVFIKFIDNVNITGNNKIQKKLFRDQKIPAPAGETIYWLVGKEYVPLTAEAWARVEKGSHKL